MHLLGPKIKIFLEEKRDREVLVMFATFGKVRFFLIRYSVEKKQLELIWPKQYFLVSYAFIEPNVTALYNGSCLEWPTKFRKARKLTLKLCASISGATFLLLKGLPHDAGKCTSPV